MLNLRTKSTERILLMNAEEFESSHTSELLAYLEDVPNFKVNNTLNFSTNIRIGSQEQIKVLHAFNIYMQYLSQSIDRIIITL